MNNVLFYKLIRINNKQYRITKFDVTKYNNRSELHTIFTQQSKVKVKRDKSIDDTNSDDNNIDVNHHGNYNDKDDDTHYNDIRSTNTDKIINDDNQNDNININSSKIDHGVTDQNIKLSTIKRYKVLCNYLDQYITDIGEKRKSRLLRKLRKLRQSGFHIYFSTHKNKLTLYVNKYKFTHGKYILLSLLKRRLNMQHVNNAIKKSMIKFHMLLHKV